METSGRAGVGRRGGTPCESAPGGASSFWAVHRFLNGVFLLASDPVDDYRGETYQYVGDEMVITWMEREGKPGARPIRCFAAIEAVLEVAAPDFVRDFGVAPRVRGALHFGPVVVGEIGDGSVTSSFTVTR